LTEGDIVPESQIDRVPNAEQAARELAEFAAQMRPEANSLPDEDPSTRRELLETVEGLEMQAKALEDALREWRKDIH
jgi:hypothetical protein